MKETFLHYIWQNQYFNKSQLKTEEGEDLVILFPGKYNLDSGPDFHFGKIRIGDQLWIGQIEIHIRASDWYAHKHHCDPAYDQVILHVVWDSNRRVSRRDNSVIPTLQLQTRVDPHLKDRSLDFLNSLKHLPCLSYLQTADPISINRMIDQAYHQRLLGKVKFYEDIWKSNNKDWQECFYQVLLRGFGFGLNTDAFLRLARLLPFRLLRKVIHNPFQIESLLFGCSGLMAGSIDDYSNKLKKEYQYLRHKFSLGAQMELQEWKFSRMRPSNFPILRIAQFAGIIAGRPTIFSELRSFDM